MKAKMNETVRIAGYSWEEGEIIEAANIPQNLRTQVLNHSTPISDKKVERAVPKKTAEER